MLTWSSIWDTIPMKKYISSLLICLLLVTQTIRIDFFIDHAEARAEDYRSIVSLIVDRDTYDIIRTKIHRYADDIQKYL